MSTLEDERPGGRSAAYRAGYEAGRTGGPYDEDRMTDPQYRQGMQDGRADAIDVDLLTHFGPSALQVSDGSLHRWWPRPASSRDGEER